MKESDLPDLPGQPPPLPPRSNTGRSLGSKTRTTILPLPILAEIESSIGFEMSFKTEAVEISAQDKQLPPVPMKKELLGTKQALKEDAAIIEEQKGSLIVAAAVAQKHPAPPPLDVEKVANADPSVTGDRDDISQLPTSSIYSAESNSKLDSQILSQGQVPLEPDLSSTAKSILIAAAPGKEQKFAISTVRDSIIPATKTIDLPASADSTNDSLVSPRMSSLKSEPSPSPTTPVPVFAGGVFVGYSTNSQRSYRPEPQFPVGQIFARPRPAGGMYARPGMDNIPLGMQYRPDFRPRPAFRPDFRPMHMQYPNYRPRPDSQQRRPSPEIQFRPENHYRPELRSDVQYNPNFRQPMQYRPRPGFDDLSRRPSQNQMEMSYRPMPSNENIVRRDSSSSQRSNNQMDIDGERRTSLAEMHQRNLYMNSRPPPSLSRSDSDGYISHQYYNNSPRPFRPQLRGPSDSSSMFSHSSEETMIRPLYRPQFYHHQQPRPLYGPPPPAGYYMASQPPPEGFQPQNLRPEFYPMGPAPVQMNEVSQYKPMKDSDMISNMRTSPQPEDDSPLDFNPPDSPKRRNSQRSLTDDPLKVERNSKELGIDRAGSPSKQLKVVDLSIRPDEAISTSAIQSPVKSDSGSLFKYAAINIIPSTPNSHGSYENPSYENSVAGRNNSMDDGTVDKNTLQAESDEESQSALSNVSSAHTGDNLSSVRSSVISETRPTFNTMSRRRAQDYMGNRYNDPSIMLEAQRVESKSSKDPKVHFEFAKLCLGVGEPFLDEGFMILRKLASSGFPEAHFLLGEAFADDEKDSQAYTHYLMAAKRGFAPACHAIGTCAEDGKGCKRNSRLALEMYAKSATAGNLESMYRLGRAEMDGDLGLRKDAVKATKWFKRAAAIPDRDHPEPLYELALIYETGVPPYILQDYAYARGVLQEATDFGYPPAIYKLGYCQEHGTMGYEAESIRLYTLAVNAGYTEALLGMAGWHMTGADSLIIQNKDMAFSLVKQAADRGLARAQYTLGYFFEGGIGTYPNMDWAFKYYELAAEQGEERAIIRIQKANPNAISTKNKKKNNFFKNLIGIIRK